MTGHAKSRPWRVVQQSSHRPDIEVCTHRWEWTAELCAHRKTARDNDTGVFYTARPGTRVAEPNA